MERAREIAIIAAKEAGSKVVELAKSEIHFKMKSSRDILAEADIASEKIIINHIKDNFPEHSIFSEEAGKDLKSSEYQWVIDPIDGTINYARKLEEYVISIALTRNSEPILGVIYQPALDKLYVAEKDKGAYMNTIRLAVSKETNPINALAAADNTSKSEIQKEIFQTLLDLSTNVRQIRIYGSVALHLAKIAEGSLDFYFKLKANYWDCAAGIILITEAGGKVSDFKNNEFSENSKELIASNNVIHQAALTLILQKNTSETK